MNYYECVDGDEKDLVFMLGNQSHLLWVDRLLVCILPEARRT
jgi:hypothetical protein